MSETVEVTVVRDVPGLSPRAAEAHKGSFGKVLIVGGSVGMSGAVVLAGTAALRGGAGLVQLAVPEPIGPVVAAGQICCTTAWLPADSQGRLCSSALPIVLELISSASAVVVGPGLGQSADMQTLILALLAEVRGPLLLDADALNVLGSHPPAICQRRAPLILTPHPGEFARLTGLEAKLVQAERASQAVTFARQHGGVLVLKGAGTIVTDGQRIYTNTTGNPGMATGGSGDVLSGLIGALLGQGLEAFDAAVLGVYLHGLAGDLACGRKGEVSLIASDLLDWLPEAFRVRALMPDVQPAELRAPSL
jgi:NAD(P)H-hydrate epimerase